MAELWQVVIVGAKADLLRIENKLQNGLEPPLSLSLFDDELPNWRLQIVLSTKPDQHWISNLDVPKDMLMHSEPLPDKNWVKESLRFLTPVTAGRFYIHGSHQLPYKEPGLVSICIPAGMAFGTGHHQTTSGCLLELDNLLRSGSKPLNVLDLGTGAGILAIAAAKTCRANIIATDIDIEAIEIAKVNAKANKIIDKIKFLEADGVDHPAVTPGRFDLIFANILAAPLIEMANGISALLTSGGTLILAGLLNTQAEAVTSAYVNSGLQPAGMQARGEWTILTMIR